MATFQFYSGGIMNRRQFLTFTAGLSTTNQLLADSRSPRNVSVDFDGPVPVLQHYKEHLSRRFSGNLLPYTHQARGPQFDSYDVVLRKVALGPMLEEGRSVYALQSDSEKLSLDLLMDAKRGTSRKYSIDSFRPIYLFEERPFALVVNRSLGVESLENLQTLAKQRSASGRHLRCEVGQELGSKLARRFARLSSATLDIGVLWGGHPRPEAMLRDAEKVDFFIAPISPLLLVPRIQDRFRIASALCLQNQPISYEFGSAPKVEDGIPRISAAGSMASMAIVPSRGFFVSSRESATDVESLFQAFRAAYLEPDMRQLNQHLVPMALDAVSAMDQRYLAEVGVYRSLASEV